MITVNTFGAFQITDGKSMINDSNINSAMMKKLLIYLIMHRKRSMTSEEVASAIWSEDETDNPLGALKNLMYRLRKLLNRYFGINDFIITDRGTYQWNNDVCTLVDAEKFEEVINSAKVENGRDKMLALYEDAATIYQGGFMNSISDMSWVNTTDMYYHSLYLTVVKTLAENYISLGRYEELERLCSHALTYEMADEQLYCYQVLARMRSGKLSLAMQSYEKAKEVIERELGIKKTTILNKVYDELMSMRKGTDADSIEEIYEDITESDPQGVYMCGYPVFKAIYQLEVRKSHRGEFPEFLLLLTIECKDHEKNIDEVNEYRLKSGMKKMEEVIGQSLRVGDVCAKYSDSQFIILLPTCDKELTLLVANRIVFNFYNSESKYKKYNIFIDCESISDDGEFIR